MYKVKDLLPIHHLCKCLTLPIYGEFDPGNTLNLDDLLPEGVTAGKALKRTRYKVGESGELGPVLIPASMTRRTAAAPAWDSPNAQARAGCTRASLGVPATAGICWRGRGWPA